MKEYWNVSIEEIRCEDYDASGGVFGSAFAKLAGALCVHPDRKLRPYCYGELYKAALSQQKNQQDNKLNLLPAVPDDVFKMQTQIQKPSNVNLCFHGKQNIKVLVNCIGDCNVNLTFKDNLDVQDFGQPSAESAEKLQKNSHSAKNEKTQRVTKRRKH